MDGVHCSEKTEAKIQMYRGKKQWTLVMVEIYREEKVNKQKKKKSRKYKNMPRSKSFWRKMINKILLRCCWKFLHTTKWSHLGMLLTATKSDRQHKNRRGSSKMVILCWNKETNNIFCSLPGITEIAFKVLSTLKVRRAETFPDVLQILTYL